MSCTSCTEDTPLLWLLMRCHEPLAEADFGVLEDDSQQYWERVVAVGAAEPAITTL